MNYSFLAVATLGTVVVIRGFLIGSASPNGENFRRDEDPFSFWLIMIASIAAIAFLFYQAVHA